MKKQEAKLNAQATLDAIAAEGARKRHEKWIVFGGLLQQGKRHLSYKEIRELAGYNAKKGNRPPGYSDTQASHLRETTRKR